MKDRDIVGVDFDGNNLIIDLRYEIPKESCSGELIKDIFNMKNVLINGSFSEDETSPIKFFKYKAKIQEDEKGEYSVIFSKNLIELI